MAQGEHGIVLAEGDHIFSIVRESTVELCLGNESIKIHYDTEHVLPLVEQLRKAARQIQTEVEAPEREGRNREGRNNEPL